MTFAIDESFLPATLNARPMTDQQFAKLCAEHPDLFLEVTAEGELLVTPPTYSLTDARNTEILGQLRNWARKQRQSTVTGSSGGFVLPNGARRSPAAAWTSKARLKELSKESLAGFWHLSPDFVIELKSNSDRLPILRKKMTEWIDNGTELGWLIDPDPRTVEIFRPNMKPEKVNGTLRSLRADGPVQGFILDLDLVWNPLA